MANFFRYCCINCSMICCIFWILWPADAKKITQAPGSRVTLNCTYLDENITLAIWKFNGKNLISFRNPKDKVRLDEGVRLKVEMSDLESERYALIIKEAQKLHEGNYTCTTTSRAGLFDESWELIIKEAKTTTQVAERTNILFITVIAAVPSVCFLILISALVILKKRKKNGSPSEIRQQKQVEDIYENHLEIQRRQAYLNKP